VRDLIADGYQAARTDSHAGVSRRTLQSDFDLRVERFADDAAGDFMQAGRKAMRAWKGDPAEALKRTVTPSDAEAMVRAHLVVEIDHEFYLSPDAIASLEQTGSISKTWAETAANAGSRSPGRTPRGRSPG
jgi:hypothetical protein